MSKTSTHMKRRKKHEIINFAIFKKTGLMGCGVFLLKNSAAYLFSNSRKYDDKCKEECRKQNAYGH